MQLKSPLCLLLLLTGCAPSATDSLAPAEKPEENPVATETPVVGEVGEVVETPEATDFTDANFLYSASVTGTDFDIITTSDPTDFCRLEYTGRSQQEMPDKTSDGELFAQAITFNAHFNHGPPIAVAMDIDFDTTSAAEVDALRYATRLGKLPLVLRSGVNRLVVHKGQPDTTAFSDVGLIVVYSANAARRIQTNDLEETLLHESVHATWDAPHAVSNDWRNAQNQDNFFISNYAMGLPEREDLAESALFAYALNANPNRLPAADAEAISRAIPARIALVQGLLNTAPQVPADARCPTG